MFVAGKEIPEIIEFEDFYVIARNCKIKEGVKINFAKSVVLENCTIEKDCTIESNLKDFHFNEFGTITIESSQEQISFNNLRINSVILENSKLTIINEGQIEICGSIVLEDSDLTITNCGQLNIKGYYYCIYLKNSQNVEFVNRGVMFLKNGLKFSNASNSLFINSHHINFTLGNKGIILNGQVFFISHGFNFAVSCGSHSLIDFGDNDQKWENVVIKNKGCFEFMNISVFPQSRNSVFAVYLQDGYVIKVASPIETTTDNKTCAEMFEILKGLTYKSYVACKVPITEKFRNVLKSGYEKFITKKSLNN